MRKGFSHGVAPKLIRQTPGMTAREVAEQALDRDLCDSDAQDPISSLANTLAKEVREGRHPEVRAEQVGGILRYYPTSVVLSTESDNASSLPPSLGETVPVRLPRANIEVADLLVETGQYKTRSEALAWLVAEGIVRNESRIRKVREAAEQIRAIKQSL